MASAKWAGGTIQCGGNLILWYHVVPQGTRENVSGHCQETFQFLTKNAQKWAFFVAC